MAELLDKIKQTIDNKEEFAKLADDTTVDELDRVLTDLNTRQDKLDIDRKAFVSLYVVKKEIAKADLVIQPPKKKAVKKK